MKVEQFSGKYAFLSNYFNVPIECFGYHFRNSEAAFQAAKCPERMSEFCNLNPSEAKRLGRKVKLRSDWEYVKDDIMFEVCVAKFTQNKELMRKLLETGSAELIEGNTWGDHTWGVCDGTGENRLGKILMFIRAELDHRDQYDKL